MKEKLAYHIEKVNLLPKYQFGGRPGHLTTDLLHVLTLFIKDAWRRGKEVVAVFIDVKGAFLNTVLRVLARDMRLRDVLGEVVGWFEEKLRGQKTVISFDNYNSLPNSGEQRPGTRM